MEYRSALDKALLACDESTGFVMACSLLRPEGIRSLEPKSVRKKLKDKAFAAGVDRHEVAEGARLLGVDLDEHLAFVIGALRPHAEELGLLGRDAAARG
jgi:predicted hydrolase (HD superfamily)